MDGSLWACFFTLAVCAGFGLAGVFRWIDRR